jgi:hypothetical protein
MNDTKKRNISKSLWFTEEEIEEIRVAMMEFFKVEMPVNRTMIRKHYLGIIKAHRYLVKELGNA